HVTHRSVAAGASACGRAWQHGRVSLSYPWHECKTGFRGPFVVSHFLGEYGPHEVTERPVLQSPGGYLAECTADAGPPPDAGLPTPADETRPPDGAPSPYARRWLLGSRASRSPSPMKFTPSTSSAMRMPGGSQNQGASWSTDGARASMIML